MTLVLSLFPGIGMLDAAFEEEGFCVVRGPDVLWGGDIRRFHPPAGKFDGVIGGPPCQCFSSLAHMVRANGHQPKFGNLIPEFERCVAEAAPAWWLMENVPQAPVPVVSGYAAWSCLLDNRQLGETQRRIRRWTFGVRGSRHRFLSIEIMALENPHFDYAACGGGRGGGGMYRENCGAASPEALARALARKRGVPVAIGGSGKEKPAVRAARRVTSAVGFNFKTTSAFRRLCKLQGLPEDFDLPPFNVQAKCQAVGNGVPMAMGRAIARAVREATGQVHREERRSYREATR
jgi:DNA (cytosine-5)-methyltransferase 1